MGFISISDIKTAAEVLKKAGQIELYEKLLEVQESALEMREQIEALKEENKTLKQQLEIKGKIIRENDAYWINENEETKGPICSKCYDDEKKLIYMIQKSDPDYYDCPKCSLRIKIGKSKFKQPSFMR